MQCTAPYCRAAALPPSRQRFAQNNQACTFAKLSRGDTALRAVVAALHNAVRYLCSVF